MGGKSLSAKIATHWHRGEPRATNGQAQKIPCRPPQVDQSVNRIVRSVCRQVAVVYSRKIK